MPKPGSAGAASHDSAPGRGSPAAFTGCPFSRVLAGAGRCPFLPPGSTSEASGCPVVPLSRSLCPHCGVPRCHPAADLGCSTVALWLVLPAGCIPCAGSLRRREAGGGKQLPELFRRGSTGPVVGPCLIQEVLPSTSKALRPALCRGSDSRVLHAPFRTPFAPIAFPKCFPWQGLSLLLWGRMAGGVLRVLAVTPAADGGQVSKAGAPTSAPRAGVSTKAWLCGRAPRTWAAQASPRLGFADRQGFACPWWGPSSSQGLRAARELCPRLSVCPSLHLKACWLSSSRKPLDVSVD